MAKIGCTIETFLFNPPYASAPIEKLIGNKYLKQGTHIAKNVVTTGISLALKRHKDHDDDQFATLRSWTPCLFVNPKDIICCQYARYFEHREKMQSWGVGEIAKLAADNSVMSLLSGVLGGDTDTEASYLIPSALISMNMKNMVIKEDGLLLAHGLSQWWEQHQCWESKLYQCS
ncbi:hypothetical protein RDABS01_015913 [Bienertia sinuspersici]